MVLSAQDLSRIVKRPPHWKPTNFTWQPLTYVLQNSFKKVRNRTPHPVHPSLVQMLRELQLKALKPLILQNLNRYYSTHDYFICGVILSGSSQEVRLVLVPSQHVSHRITLQVSLGSFWFMHFRMPPIVLLESIGLCTLINTLQRHLEICAWVMLHILYYLAATNVYYHVYTICVQTVINVCYSVYRWN